MKILNLYAGVGGNRKLWGSEHEVTAVELNPTIAEAYKDMYPDDTVIVGDAHQYLLDHYKEFDFIWTSPPCQSHSRLKSMGIYQGKSKAEYFDMKLWQEIILLQNFNKCDWVVENVIPYYEPLIPPTFKLQRHLYWSNKSVPPLEVSKEDDIITNGSNEERQRSLGIYVDKYHFEGVDRRQVLRNCVRPEVGLYILNKIIGEG